MAERISRFESVQRDQSSDQPDVKTVQTILATSIQQACPILHETQLQHSFNVGLGYLQALAD